MKKLSLILLTLAFNSINCANKLARLARCITTTSLRNVTKPVNVSQLWQQNICTTTKPTNSLSKHVLSPASNHYQKNLIHNPKRHLFFWRVFDENIIVYLPDPKTLEENFEKAGYYEFRKESALIRTIYSSEFRFPGYLGWGKLTLKSLIDIVEGEVCWNSRLLKDRFPREVISIDDKKQLADDILKVIWQSRIRFEMI